MFNVILFEPEIPPNTGNVMRLCANTGCRLHLLQPLGFSLDDAKLRRAGLDYREWADVRVHDSLQACLSAINGGQLWAFSTRGSGNHAEVCYQPGDNLLFGPETRGLPASVLGQLESRQVVRVPMLAGNRSINLSNTVAVVVYEAWRQHGFAAGS